MLQGFGDMELQQRRGLTLEDQVARFVGWCFDKSRAANAEGIARYDRDLEIIARQRPEAWLDSADFRYEHKLGKRQIESATRHAVEEMPFNTEAWRRRAFDAKAAGDDAAEVAAWISAVESSPEDVPLMVAAAKRLARYVSDHKSEIPEARRGVYLASVREVMVRSESSLDGDGLSRLAWLFLLEGKEAEAESYARRGCALDPANENCHRLLLKLQP